MQVYEVSGPFFFGVADKLRDVLNIVAGPPKVMVLRMRHVPIIDATGLHALDEFQRNCQAKGTALILAGIRRQPLEALQHAPTWARLDPKNVVKNIDSALERAREILGLPLPTQTARKRKGRAA